MGPLLSHEPGDRTTPRNWTEGHHNDIAGTTSSPGPPQRV
ncbi:hypothetical protein HMPREF9057_03127 [Actinomyces sp. oral taxon 171 str. F0337]|nr:hypothetical protein HMPREF9057_03127 [Actinomyces sp. oral taxon 171 str. F0337]